MEAYFDNSATTVVTPGVRDIVVRAMTEDFGNPSSAHLKGVQAERYLKEARERIAHTLHCSEKEIFFTSGGTESDNWALIGAAFANQRAGKHLITTSVEHSAVLRTMQFLEDQGFRVTYLPVNAEGRVSEDDFRAALDSETILVSMMLVNNEVGTVQPVEQCCAILKKTCPGALFHTDAVQAYGKIPIQARRLGVDMLSVSGHKLHAPKGTGFLYVKEKTKLNPLILGGGQQKGMRSGTDNVPGAAGLGLAAMEAVDHLESSRSRMLMLKQRLTEGLLKIKGVRVHSGDGDLWAPHIVNASFVGVRSEVLLHALEDREIYVSAGSACSTNRKLPVSPVLQQLGLPREEMESALRFSFSRFNTPEEVDYCLQALNEFVPVLRRYQRR